MPKVTICLKLDLTRCHVIFSTKISWSSLVSNNNQWKYKCFHSSLNRLSLSVNLIIYLSIEQNDYFFITSAPIGSWERNFLVFLGNNDRTTNRRTWREFTLHKNMRLYFIPEETSTDFNEEYLHNYSTLVAEHLLSLEGSWSFFLYAKQPVKIEQLIIRPVHTSVGLLFAAPTRGASTFHSAKFFAKSCFIILLQLAVYNKVVFPCFLHIL